MKGHNKNKGREGTTLISVVIISILVTSIAGGLIGVASQQAHSINRQRDIVKARSLAEAGAAEAFAILMEDFSNKDNASLFPPTSFGGGQYDATVTSVDSRSILIASKGTIDDVEIEVILQVGLDPDSTEEELDPETDPFAHAIYASGDWRCNGNGSLVGSGYAGADFRINGSSSWDADVRARASAQVIGGSSVFNGTIWSPSISGSGSGGISDPQVGPVPLIPFPTMDLTEYYNIAVANGQVYSGGTVDGNIGAIPGGVRWYNGNAKFTGGVNYSGCIIATGYLWFNGGMTQTKVGALPAAVSRDSYIRFNGSRTAEGLVYAAGDVTFNGSGTLAGTVISGGDVTFNGSYGIITYRKSVPGGPADTGDTEAAEITTTVWQK